MTANREREQRIDDLLLRAEARRREALRLLNPVEQRDLGQFFTPRQVAERMAAEPRLPAEGSLRVLDPGAGSGSLVAALIARIMREQPGLTVTVTAVELASRLQIPLRETLEDCREDCSCTWCTSRIRNHRGRLYFLGTAQIAGTF